jgi:hypothetical protein
MLLQVHQRKGLLFFLLYLCAEISSISPKFNLKNARAKKTNGWSSHNSSTPYDKLGMGLGFDF